MVLPWFYLLPIPLKTPTLQFHRENSEINEVSVQILAIHETVESLVWKKFK
jgi:hypothetical protein